MSSLTVDKSELIVQIFSKMVKLFTSKDELNFWSFFSEISLLKTELMATALMQFCIFFPVKLKTSISAY